LGDLFDLQDELPASKDLRSFGNFVNHRYVFDFYFRVLAIAAFASGSITL
jgi:hypothetical protein